MGVNDSSCVHVSLSQISVHWSKTATIYDMAERILSFIEPTTKKCLSPHLISIVEPWEKPSKLMSCIKHRWNTMMPYPLWWCVVKSMSVKVICFAIHVTYAMEIAFIISYIFIRSSLDASSNFTPDFILLYYNFLESAVF